MPAEIIEFEQYTSSYASNIDYGVSEALKIVADNGSTITQAVDNIVYAGNGAASRVSSITSAVSAGAATVTSAGYAIGALEVTTAGAMLIPALGLGAGALLYNLAPEFWTNVSNKLLDAGKTIGGKIACFFNEDGQTLIDSEVMNVFKDELINGEYYKNSFEFTPISVKLGGSISLDSLWYMTAAEFLSFFLPDTARSDFSSDITSFNIYSYVNNVFNANTIGVVSQSGTGRYTWYGNVEILTNDPSSFIITRRVLDNQYSYYTTSSSIIRTTGYIGLYDLSRYPSGVFTFQTSSGTHYTFSSIEDYPAKYMGGIYFGNFQNSNPYIESNAILPNESESIINTFGDNITIYNIPTTNPNEYIQAIPIEIPDLNPSTTQEQALNPDNGKEAIENDNIEIVSPIIRWIKDNIVLPNPSPDSDTDPSPQPDPDPDPQPEPDPLPEPDPVEDETDPIDPNSDPPTPDTPILPVLPSTVSSNKLFTVYNPTLSQLNELGGFLWSSDIVDTLKKIWQDPLDGIISLRQVYCTPTTGNTSNIILGTLDSGVSSLVVTNQFVTQDCGTISLPEFFKNATDYSPYTQLHLYLPFIGIVEINVNEFMNGSINVVYHFDVYTGSILTEVRCTRNNDMPSPTILYTFTGNASQALPITAANYQGAINASIGVATGALTLATGGGINPIFTMANIAHSVTHEMVHVNHASSLSGNSGIMGSRYPQLIVSRRKSFDANAYNDFYGYPTNKTVYLSNCSGYTRIKAIHLASAATQDEKNEIETLLKNGVIF